MHLKTNYLPKLVSAFRPFSGRRNMKLRSAIKAVRTAPNSVPKVKQASPSFYEANPAYTGWYTAKKGDQNQIFSQEIYWQFKRAVSACLPFNIRSWIPFHSAAEHHAVSRDSYFTFGVNPDGGRNCKQ